MIGIDAFLLDLVERACHRVQLLTGRTNAWLAVQLTNLSIATYFVWAVTYFQRVHIAARVAVVAFCGLLLYGLSQTVFKVSIEASEQEAYRRVSKGLRNPRRLRDAPLRTSFLTLSVILLYPLLLVQALRATFTLLTYSLVPLTTLLLYVLSCDPLPPCPGKVKEWLLKLRPVRQVERVSSSSVNQVSTFRGRT
jgi:hypothetical protein